jgi:hypothetical protein
MKQLQTQTPAAASARVLQSELFAGERSKLQKSKMRHAGGNFSDEIESQIGPMVGPAVNFEGRCEKDGGSRLRSFKEKWVL